MPSKMDKAQDVEDKKQVKTVGRSLLYQAVGIGLGFAVSLAFILLQRRRTTRQAQEST